MSKSNSAVIEREQDISDYDYRPDNAKNKPKIAPRWAVILLNDDFHTVEYVIETLQKVFKFDTQKALVLALKIHDTGRQIVWTGSKEVAELKKEQIQSCGPDLYAKTKVEFALGVDLEEVP